MDVIIKTYLDMVDREAVLGGDIMQDLFDFVFKFNRHPLVAVLRPPNNVIVDIVDASSTMCIFRIFLFHKDIVAHFATLYKREGAFISALKTEFPRPELKRNKAAGFPVALNHIMESFVRTDMTGLSRS